jgi:CheY-like chemotaxis protein
MKKTILLVDDDASVRESVEKVLRGAGYEVVLAAGGLQAVTQVQAQPIDLVLLDIGLPNKNGWEACQHLHREHPNLPIIVITGQAGQFKSALAGGAVALMEKPLDAHRLLQVIQELFVQGKPSDPSASNPTFYHIGA